MVSEEKGSDFEGKMFSNIQEMWDTEVKKKEDWYGHSLSYWKKQSATVDGMLGGLGFLADEDIRSSKEFLLKLCNDFGLKREGKALDCGAGIGRVSETLLLQIFDRVDLLEPNEEFVKEAKRRLLPMFSQSNKIIENFFVSGLQEFTFTNNSANDGLRYDCIWIQWVIIYLTDDDFIAFLERAKSHLVPETGVICIKDNVTRSGSDCGFALDRQDSSVTRSENMLQRIFKAAGLRVLEREEQKNFPKELFPVITYALVPEEK